MSASIDQIRSRIQSKTAQVRGKLGMQGILSQGLGLGLIDKAKAKLPTGGGRLLGEGMQLGQGQMVQRAQSRIREVRGGKGLGLGLLGEGGGILSERSFRSIAGGNVPTPGPGPGHPQVTSNYRSFVT